MYPSVKEVTPGDNYTLSVVFDNGEKGHLDMKPVLDFGIFPAGQRQYVSRRIACTCRAFEKDDKSFRPWIGRLYFDGVWEPLRRALGS